MLARRLRDLFLQDCSPIQHHRKGYGSTLRHRHTDEKTPAVCCDIAADKARRQLEKRPGRPCLKCRLCADVDRHKLLVGSYIEQLFAIPTPSGVGSTSLGNQPLPRGISRSLSRAEGELPYINFVAAGLVRCVRDPMAIGRKLT